MANSIPKKRAKAEQLRKKRAQAASVPAHGAMKPLKAISVAPRPQRPSVGRATAMSAPLPPAHYPAKRVAIGKPQTAGGR
jgi:hypothetical protein